MLFDYDGDGWLDILLVDGGSVADAGVAARAKTRLFRNRRNGTFDDVTEAAKIPHLAYGMGACAADYDNDGHEDVYLTNFGPNVLYHNNGDGTFADVTTNRRRRHIVVEHELRLCRHRQRRPARICS